MVANAGQHNPGDAWIVPGRIASPPGTGAGQGSEGGQVTPSVGSLATVPVVPVYESSQGVLDTFRVDYNDTSSMSSDNSNELWLTGGNQDSAAWSAGISHVAGFSHPNAAANSGQGSP